MTSLNEAPHPTDAGPRPPFPEQQQRLPGTERGLTPRADHGEESYQGHGRLEGKVTLVTGGDSGIGKAACIAFAREGADVVLCYVGKEEDADAEDTARHVREAGRRALIVRGNLASPEGCRELVAASVGEFGRIDVLVNNAAHQLRYQQLEEIPGDDWEYTFRVNVHAMFYLCQAAWPHMPPGSVVINTTSIQGFRPSPSLLAYATTKGAIVTFTRALAQIGAERGIRVNAVAPGPVWTPLIPATTEASPTASFGEENPLGRPAQPAELAPAYVFLASPGESGFVSGEVLGVHGGMPVGT